MRACIHPHTYTPSTPGKMWEVETKESPDSHRPPSLAHTETNKEMLSLTRGKAKTELQQRSLSDSQKQTIAYAYPFHAIRERQ